MVSLVLRGFDGKRVGSSGSPNFPLAMQRIDQFTPKFPNAKPGKEAPNHVKQSASGRARTCDLQLRRLPVEAQRDTHSLENIRLRRVDPDCGNGQGLIGCSSNPRGSRLDRPFRAGELFPTFGTFRANNAGGRANFSRARRFFHSRRRIRRCLGGMVGGSDARRGRALSCER